MKNPTVLIFGYNRPKLLSGLTRTIINSINYEDFSYVFHIDGPRQDSDICLIDKSHLIAKEFQQKLGKERVSIDVKNANLGLANSIIKGVSQTLETSESVIVLEDDLEISSSALNFFSRGLHLYKEKSQVGAICGYIPFQGDTFHSTFFLNEASCWGWATWADRWRNINWDASNLYRKIVDSGRSYEFDSSGNYPFTELLRLQRDELVDSWAIRWQASLFLENKLCLYPNKSLITNLGFKGDGTHGTKDNRYEVELCQNFDVAFKEISLEEDSGARIALSDFYKNLNTQSFSASLYVYFRGKLKRFLRLFFRT